MTLLEEAMEPFIIMNKVKTDDGYGGTKTVWSEGITIKGAMVLNSSTEALIAEAQGVTSKYTFTTKKSISLEYHDVIKRKSDNKIFRVTSDGDDKHTPKSSSLNMRQVTAEEWELS